VLFAQEHPPGRQGLSDFTDAGELGSVALRDARVKVRCTVSLVSDPVGVTPPACRIVALRTEPLPSSRICPLRTMCISSTPLRMIRAQRKSLKPCIRRVMRLIAR
jgi:hypothetical protein